MATATISCPQCKKSFKGRDDLWGKRVKCPGCGHGFVCQPPASIDDADAAAAALLMNEAATGSAPDPPKQPDFDPMFDQDANPYGVHTMQLKARCPNCANEMASEDAVICLFCGYNTQTRRVGETKKVVQTTAIDYGTWITPGILCAGGILLIALNMIINDIWSQYVWRNDPEKWYKAAAASEPNLLLWTMGWLATIWRMGLFAFKRLIVEPTPPEAEMD
jgi:hypothetical protein